MKTFVKQLANPGASLACYIQDYSKEMPNVTKRPAMLVIPGGAYMMCSDREAEPVALAYLAEGFNAFILRYSVGKDVPCQLAYDDAVEAIKFLRADCWELRIDPDKIAAVGFSAGGNLAAWISTHGDARPNAAILGYPATIQESGNMLGKTFPELFDNIDVQTPPTFLFHARDDKVVPIEHAIKYLASLTKAGVPFESHIFAGGGHGFSLAKPLTASGSKDYVDLDTAKWLPLSVKWLWNLFGEFEIAENVNVGKKTDTNLAIGELRDNFAAWGKVLEIFPQMDKMIEDASTRGMGDFILGAPLRGIAEYSPEIFKAEQLDALDKALSELGV